MNIANKMGTITLRTTNGIMQLYVKNDEVLISSVKKDLVTYMNMHSVHEMMPPFGNVLYNILPSKLSLSILAKNIVSNGQIKLGDEYGEVEEFLKFKNGKKTSLYTLSTANNDKVNNLFNEYKDNPDMFKGFCNYKIDGLGNISDVEMDLLRKSYDVKYSIVDYIEETGKVDNTENYIKKIFKNYLKENKKCIGDIKKIEFDKTIEKFKEIDEHMEDSQEDFVYSLINQKKNVDSRLRDIDNIKKYINDSRIQDIYSNDEIVLALSEVYMNEKLTNRKDKEEILEIVGKSYLDEKIMKIIEEDVVTSSKKQKIKGFEDLDAIKYLRNMAYVKDCTVEEISPVIKELKRYVDVVQSYDFLGKHEDITDVQRDELAIIMKNYENHICSGILTRFGISNVCSDDVKYLNVLKNSVMKERLQYDDIISFAVNSDIAQKDSEQSNGTINERVKNKGSTRLESDYEDEDEKSVNKVIYTYLTKGKEIEILKDNKRYMQTTEEDEKDKYKEHDLNFKDKSRLSDIIGKGNFAYVEGDTRVHIDREYQKDEVSSYEEKMEMTNDIVDDLLLRRQDSKSELKIIEESEVNKLQSLLDNGKIEEILDYVSILRSASEIDELDLLGQELDIEELDMTVVDDMDLLDMI